MQEEQVDFRERKPLVIVHDAPKFDLSFYISNYKGRTVFRRLYLIASCSTVLGEEAARLAVIEAKKGCDVRNYLEAVTLLKKKSRSGDKSELTDSTWAIQQEKKNGAETHRLENELKGYKNNLIKESIRMGNEDLGTHYHTIGDLRNANKAYVRMRDYCTTPAHIASSAFRLINVSVEQSRWLDVRSQILKIRNLQMKPEDSQRHQPKISAVSGLHLMAEGEYGEAALNFLKTDPSLGDNYNDIMTSNDVAVYGGLCALASMSRTELQTKVLDNASFRNFLELEPHIRRAISFFCGSKYSQCLDILESYRADYLLDIYLQPHVADIYHKVRTKSIVQYFQPFSKVTLTSMGKMFGNPSTTQNGVNGNSTITFLDELIDLIETGKLDARVDLETGVLEAKESNTRADILNDASEMINGFIREAQLKSLRLNAINAGLEVKAQNKKKPWDEKSTTEVPRENGRPLGTGPKSADINTQQNGPVGPGGRSILTGNFRGGVSIRGS